MNTRAKLLTGMTLSLALLSGCSTLTAQQQVSVTRHETQSFADVGQTVADYNNKYGADQVLIVVDIDNTLLTSTVDLGGDVWYQWQRNKLAIKPGESQKVACLFEDAIGLLYELGPMVPTQDDLPARVKNWQAGGNTVMALTSRAPKYRPATERELARNGFDLTTTALAPKGQPAPVYREIKGRELSYMQGVMMTSGMNKGEMLDYILDKTDRQFKAIVFVDDSQKNIDNVYAQFSKTRESDVSIFHFTRIEEARKHQYGAVLTQAQADKMDADWKALNQRLDQVFPDRRLSQGCLGQ